jgi:glycosyltransferase involved in cell wall biosynthesis
MSISVCIICFNEERNIRRCLESASWAEETIVVDSLSQDGTMDIVRRFPVRTYQREWTGYVDQKNYALSKANGEWILSLDADEEVTTALRDEILNEVEKERTWDGYRIRRKSFFQGRWMSHCGFYPDRQLRFFRRDRAKWVGERLHERLEVSGSVGDLGNDLLHYPYKGTISGLVRTVDVYSGLYAKDMYEEGKHCRVVKLIFRPLFKFAEIYFLKFGFLDRMPGFLIAVTFSYGMFIRYLKLKELERGT